jgi:hypothetical protein
VDHIFFLNPTEQLANRLPPIPDWTNLVYREIFLKMTESKEIRTIQDIFENFDTANKSFITLEEFKNALITLGIYLKLFIYIYIPTYVYIHTYIYI